MESNWVGYRGEVENEGEPMMLSFLVDVARAEGLPHRDRPESIVVALTLQGGKRNDGFGSEEERQALAMAEDKFLRNLSRTDAELVASVRGAGVYHLWMYGKKGVTPEVEKCASRCFKDWGFRVDGRPDPKWSQYEEMLPTPDQHRIYLDECLIMNLVEAGDQIKRPRVVDHCLLLPDAKSANAVVARAEKDGFEVTDRQTGEDDSVMVQVSMKHAVNIEAISPVTLALTKLAEQHGGMYDGWQTPIIKKPR